MPSDELAGGTLLQQGRYEILKKIGKGGMGYVYKANDRERSCCVALKQTLFASQSYKKEQEQFAQEADLLTRLEHQSLPKVRDYFVEESGRYLVMDFIEGPDMGVVLQTGFVFPPAFALPIAEQLLRVLDYLHSQSPVVIHRDIKPQNIKISRGGQVFLLDFSLAKDMSTGTIIRGFSPHYSPLEQRQGLTTDIRGDLYSLGATLYHMVTGTAPCDALEKRLPAMVRNEQDPLIPVSTLNRSVPSRFETLIMGALKLYPSDRPADAGELLAGLRQEDVEADGAGTLRRSAALKPTVLDTPAVVDVAARRMTRFKVAQDEITYEYCDGKAVVTYLPPAFLSPTMIRAETLKVKFKEGGKYQIVITDTEYDPFTGTGTLCHSGSYDGIVNGFHQSIELAIESLPQAFRLTIHREGSDSWDTADFRRNSSVLRWQKL